MKYFITGGAGFIGSHLVKKLSENKNNKICIYDNFYRGKIENVLEYLDKDRVYVEEGDIRDLPSLQKEMSGFDIVFHLAAQSNVIGSMNDPDYCRSTNEVGTSNILLAASRSDVSKIIFTSSREVYGEQDNFPVKESSSLLAKNIYGKSKITGEKFFNILGKEYDLDFSILRLSNVYGSGDSDRVIPIWMEQLGQEREVTIYGGNQIIDFIHVDIVVNALMKMPLTTCASPINIGSGVGIGLMELWERLSDFYPSGKMKVLETRNCEVQKYIADIDNMTNILGIRPPKDPLYGLQQMIGEKTYAI